MPDGNVSSSVAQGLIQLNERIKKARIPSSKLDETLNIATWNIRNLGGGKRSVAAIHYIAEIIRQFDLVGIVELKDNLRDLARVLEVLGPTWRALYSDSIRDYGGNWERVAYVYDKRAVTHTGFAAAAQPPRAKKGSEYVPLHTWWRTPYMASFRAGFFDFVVLTTHVRWGDSVAKRIDELESLAEWIDLKQKGENREDADLLVMGDFNIINDKMLLAITSRGLKIPQPLMKKTFGTNLEKNKRYDQILHSPAFPELFDERSAGVLDFYAGDIESLFPGMQKPQFIEQISDHLPLWIQIRTDNRVARLTQLVQG
jgi:endonuclease/exonuclease/phosphatase family metal-dependent hydrolase